jgi:hypothetical protein
VQTFWVLIVDDYTDYCWSIFLKDNSELKEKMMMLLTDLKISGKTSDSFVVMTQEKTKLFKKSKASLKHQTLHLNFRDLRHLNATAKLKGNPKLFYGRIKANLNCAGLKDRLRNGVWAECTRSVTFLSNMTALKSRDVCPY